MTYEPRPTDTSHITLSPRILALTEQLAEHAHEVWSQQRIADGWQYGPQRDDTTKANPCLVPYAALSDVEQQYDRNAALQTLKVISALGYRIVPPPTAAGGDQAARDAAELLLVRLKEAQTNAGRLPSGEPNWNSRNSCKFGDSVVKTIRHGSRCLSFTNISANGSSSWVPLHWRRKWRGRLWS